MGWTGDAGRVVPDVHDQHAHSLATFAFPEQRKTPQGSRLAGFSNWMVATPGGGSGSRCATARWLGADPKTVLSARQGDATTPSGSFAARLHAHAAHAAHTTHVAAAHAAHAAGRFILRRLGDHALGRQHQGCDGSCVLQRGAGHLGRVQDTHFDHVAIGVVGGVEAVVALAGQHRVDHHRGFAAGVVHDLAQGRLDGLEHQGNAVVLVGVVTLDGASGLLGAQQGHAATGHDAFFHRSTRGVQGVFDAGLLFLHLDFGGSADLDHGHAAGQLGHALLQLLAVVVGRGFLDLHANLLDAGFDVSGGAGAVDDDGVFLAHFDALGGTEVGQGDLFERQADFFSDDLAAGQGSMRLKL
jgi:hypothetical protein